MATKVRAKPIAPADTGPQVYDYGRFSFSRQASGGSKRRQQGDDDSENRARKYAAKVGLPFNETLRMFDEGLSAYHGDNVARGALGKFLAAIETGVIAPGSVLWVESIDRLTRQNPLKGLKLILFGIIEKDISIYVDDLHEVYSTDNADDTIGELYGEIKRAHRESKRKSDLALAGWQQRRKDVRAGTKELLDAKHPHWIKVVAGKKVLHDGAKKAFTLLFQRKEKTPKVGSTTIARELNAKAPWQPSGGWTNAYVYRCLRNRALIGDKQPGQLIGGQLGERVPEGDVIADYYPTAVDRGLFLRVQQILAKSNGNAKGGRNDKLQNLLQGLCHCPYCGGKFRHHNDGTTQILHCIKRRRSKKLECNAPSVPYKLCEDAILEHCKRLRVDQILPAKSQQQKLIRATHTTIETLSAELEDIKEQIANFEDQIGRTKDAKRRDSYEAKIVALETGQAGKEKHLTTARQELQRLTSAQTSFEEWQKNIDTLRKSLDSHDMRLRLNGHLAEFIEKIEVYSRGYPDPLEKCFDPEVHDDNFEQWLAAVEAAGTFRFKSQQQRSEFVAWATLQRRSRKGRFLRVYYRHTDAQRERMQKTWGDAWRPFLDVPLADSVGCQPNPLTVLDQFNTRKTKRMLTNG